MLAPKRLRAIPPTEGIILSKAALQSLLKIIADCLRSANPSYDNLFRRIASVDDRLGPDPHCDNGIVPRSSTVAILPKRLSYDGLALLRQSAIIFNNDCKAAFDRTIPSVGGIALRHLGASTNAVSTLLKTLQQMKYQVRTSLGLSDQAFSNLNDWVFGILQGSGASPCLWMAITCVLLGALQKRSPGITFSNPRGTAVCNRIGKAYVDATEFWLTISEFNITQLATEMQDIAQHWEQLLFTTGGALALEKMLLCGLGVELP